MITEPMNTKLMDVSQLAMVLAMSIFYGALLLLAVVVYRRSGRQSEPFLFLKLAGYLFLAAFTFRMNGFPLPAGLVIAYVLQRRAALNRRAKQTAILIGALLFLIGLYPLDQRIDRMLYPRSEITTYLHKDLNPAETGFNMMVFTGEESAMHMVTEKKAEGLELYEALAESEETDAVPGEMGETHGYLQLHQDHDQDRFRRMVFEVDRQGRYLILQAGGETYSFKTSERFQALFQTMLPISTD